jgi:tetratricopeptide (TPR) repeat protein
MRFTSHFPSGRAARLARTVAAAALLVLAAACATRTTPPLPTTLRYAEYLYPAVPPELRQAPGAERVDAGWRFLQNGDLRNAEREFAAALRRSPDLYPAQAGAAYVALAQEQPDQAATAFERALRTAPRYVPALVGRGQALLALGRDDEALATFESALGVDPTLSDIGRRVELLRFRNVQEVIGTARTAAAAGRLPEARGAYERALKVTPDSPFLHRELGLVERRAGNADAALTHLRRAAELDPYDAASLLEIAQILEQREDFAGAGAAYRKAAAIEPSAELSARIAAVEERAREARLPEPYRAIATAREITRGELAALIGVRLESVLREATARPVVATDIAGHWAAGWIDAVARAGIMSPFENHTFQPRARVRRGDLAQAVSRLLSLMASTRPALRVRLDERPAVADMARTHLSYPAVATAVATGVLPLTGDNRFQVGRAVSGAEATAAIDRLRALAAR